MPVIGNFKSTTILNAFILNALTASIVILMAIEINNKFINKTNTGKQTYNTSLPTRLLLTFISTFLAYTIMYIIFGFGGGMLITSN